jgi:MFS family permease
VLDWSAIFMNAAFGTAALSIGAGAAAVGFAAYSATMAIGRLTGDGLRARFGAVALVRYGGLLSAIGMAMALFVPSLPAAVIGYALFGAGLSNMVPVLIGAAGKIPGENAGVNVAATVTMGYTGFMVGPPAIGITAHASTLTIGLTLVVLACIAIGLSSAVVSHADVK